VQNVDYWRDFNQQKITLTVSIAKKHKIKFKSMLLYLNNIF